IILLIITSRNSSTSNILPHFPVSYSPFASEPRMQIRSSRAQASIPAVTLIKGRPMHSHLKPFPITLLFLNLTILTFASTLQVAPVFKAHKPVFIDKPLAASLDDARAIVKLSKETGTPFFSASSYRFHSEIPKLREAAAHATKVQACSPFNKLAFHPDLYFYG